MSLLNQLRIFRNFLITYWGWSKPKKVTTCEDTLLIIKLDAIGDYILFRNFIEDLRKSERFKNHNITLCGNNAWRDFSISLDSSYINDFIWINIDTFKNNKKYRNTMLDEIRNRGFESVIQPTFSRKLLSGDVIVYATEAKMKIGFVADKNEQCYWQRIISNRFYTDLIDTDRDNIFEFNRNRCFFETILGVKLTSRKPVISLSDVVQRIKCERYAVVFPGASDIHKHWAHENFADVARYLTRKYGHKVIIAGSGNETKIAHEICLNAATNTMLDLTGKTTLIELTQIIRGAEILISNDTCAVHIAAAVGTKTVCIASGGHYGRFIPYPPEISNSLICIYPKKILDLGSDREDLPRLLDKYNSGYDINSVSVGIVVDSIKRLLEK